MPQIQKMAGSQGANFFQVALFMEPDSRVAPSDLLQSELLGPNANRQTQAFQFSTQHGGLLTVPSRSDDTHRRWIRVDPFSSPRSPDKRQAGLGGFGTQFPPEIGFPIGIHSEPAFGIRRADAENRRGRSLSRWAEANRAMPAAVPFQVACAYGDQECFAGGLGVAIPPSGEDFDRWQVRIQGVQTLSNLLAKSIGEVVDVGLAIQGWGRRQFSCAPQTGSLSRLDESLPTKQLQRL
jgi:hypothetical protein